MLTIDFFLLSTGITAKDETVNQETSPSNGSEVIGVNNEDTPAPSAMDQSADQSSPETIKETSNQNQSSVEQNSITDMAEEKNFVDPADQSLAEKPESDIKGSQIIPESSQQSDTAESKDMATVNKGEKATVEAQETDNEVKATAVAENANGGEAKDDDDAVSIASSGHSDAYESAGEAPGTGETSEARASHEFEKEIEAPEFLDHTDNTIIFDPEHTPIISPNGLSPREQEKAGKCLLRKVSDLLSRLKLIFYPLFR